MSRGGARPNAGRKSQWASGCTFAQTKTIRVPQAIAAPLLDKAHELDSLQCPRSSEEELREGCLSEPSLSRRLGIIESELKSIRLAIAVDLDAPDAFRQWISKKDPQGLDWIYSEDDHLYYLDF